MSLWLICWAFVCVIMARLASFVTSLSPYFTLIMWWHFVPQANKLYLLQTVGFNNVMFIKNIIWVKTVKPLHTIVFHFVLQACELHCSLPALTRGTKKKPDL